MTIAEELMQEELEAHGYGDIHLCYARISNLKSAIKEINSLEQQNTALQARIKQLEDVNKNYGDTILELRRKVKDLEEPNTCDVCRYNNHLANGTDPCNSCMRRSLYLGYCNDSFELKQKR